MASSESEPPVYSESRPFVPPVTGWAVLALAAYINTEVMWYWLHGQGQSWASLPGAFAFLAIGLGAVVARQFVTVTSTELRVGNTPRLSRSIPLMELQQIELKERPPSRWRPTWPIARFRVYSMDRGPGVLLTLLNGERLFIGSATADALADALSHVAPHVRTSR